MPEPWPRIDTGKLRDLYRAAGRDPYPGDQFYFGDTLPTLPQRPTMFQPDPLVIGSPDYARRAKELYDLDPRTKSNIGIISTAPTSKSMWKTAKDQTTYDPVNPADFIGIVDKVSKPGDTGLRQNIYSVPEYEHGREVAMRTLAHEIGHTAGIKHGQNMTNVENTVESSYGTLPKLNLAEDLRKALAKRGFKAKVRIE
jgi:hypothetical protein